MFYQYPYDHKQWLVSCLFLSSALILSLSLFLFAVSDMSLMLMSLVAFSCKGSLCLSLQGIHAPFLLSWSWRRPYVSMNSTKTRSSLFTVCRDLAFDVGGLRIISYSVSFYGFLKELWQMKPYTMWQKGSYEILLFFPNSVNKQKGMSDQFN